MLGSNQRHQREWPTARSRTITRPTIGRTGGAIVTSPDRLPLDHALTVGRQAMPGQVVLDHPNVSRRHAAFEVAGSNIVLRDLGGANGTYVNGTRLRGARSLVSGDRIDIGPFELTFDGTALTRVWRVGNVELLVRGVSYDVPDEVSQRILHDANLRIGPSEFVAIIGANGSGKSTLMNIMAGRVLPSEGRINDLLLNTRPLGVTVAADDSHQIRPVTGQLAIDHEFDGVAGAAIDPICVTGNLEHANGNLVLTPAEAPGR